LRKWQRMHCPLYVKKLLICSHCYVVHWKIIICLCSVGRLGVFTTIAAYGTSQHQPGAFCFPLIRVKKLILCSHCYEVHWKINRCHTRVVNLVLYLHIYEPTRAVCVGTPHLKKVKHFVFLSVWQQLDKSVYSWYSKIILPC
jgi:hypothetical protein